MNIHWHEQESPFPGELQAQMVDLSFRLSGRQLQSDCALTLYYTIAEHLTWITHEPKVGILLSLGPSSANGWQRPDNEGVIQLSQRARLILRVPKHRVAQGRELTGHCLHVDRFELLVGQATIRNLQPSATLFARHVILKEEPMEESAFTVEVMAALDARAIEVGKLLCGREHQLRSITGHWNCRSLMLAELAPRDSLALQDCGLGLGRQLGCGLFLHHKSIGPVQPMHDD